MATYGPNLLNSSGGQALKAQIDRLNQGRRVPLPARQPKKFYWIHNVSPYFWDRSMGGLGTYKIQACPADKQFAVPLRIPEFIYEYKCAEFDPRFGNKAQEYREQDGLELCRDLVGLLPPVQEDNDLSKRGVFISENEVPTAEELREAKKKMLGYMQELVREANVAWNTGDRLARLGIQGNQKYIIAAQYLLIETEWASLPQQNVACPACGLPMPANAAIHSGSNGCGAILNKEFALKYGLIEEKEEPKEEKGKKLREI